MSQRIENYVANLEKTIVYGPWKLIEMNQGWVEDFTPEAGVYALREEGQI